MSLRFVPLTFLAAAVAAAGPTFEHTWEWQGNNCAWTVEQTADGGYLVGAAAGRTAPFDYPIMAMKTDSFGDTAWTRVFWGNPGLSGGYACTVSGGYALAGTNVVEPGRCDVCVFGVTPDGDSAWAFTYCQGSNCVLDATSTPDGGVAVTGWFTIGGLHGSGLIRLDSTGALMWMKVYDMPYWTAAKSVRVTPDRGFIISGEGDPLDGAYSDSIWLLRTDSVGDTLWTRCYGGRMWCTYSMCVTHDSGFAVGAIAVGSANRDVGCLLRTNAKGESLWTRRLEVDTFYKSEVRAVSETHDHGFILAGGVWYSGGFPCPLWLVRTDSAGNMLWQRTFLPKFSRTALAWDVKETADHGFVVVGEADASRVYLIKTDSLGFVVSGIAEGSSRVLTQATLTVSPNPASRQVRVRHALPGAGPARLGFYDVAGQLVRADVLNSNEAKLDLSGLRAGIYLLELKRDGRTASGKLTIN